MPLLALALLVVSLGLYFVPVYLLQRKTYGRTQDYFVSFEPTPPGVIQNSCIAYALRVTTFVPLFAWGASGDFWPAIVTSASLGLGLYLLYAVRRPMLEFLDDALSRDRSITIHEFIACQHGNDPRVRLLASGLTVFALTGLVIGEAFAVAMLLRPILFGPLQGACLVIVAMLVLMGLYAIPAGNSGVMRSAQSQLGLLYPTLFASTALLLYMVIASVRPMPPHGIFALLFVIVFCASMICYRRSRYVDASPITKTSYGKPESSDRDREPRVLRVFRWFEKKLNGWITALAAAVIGLSLMKLISEDFLAIVPDSAAALQTGTRMYVTGLAALFLLPLFHPIADMTNWQRIAALAKAGESSNLERSQRFAAVRRVLRIYATESALVGLFMCMFGALAVLATAVPEGADNMPAFIGQLAAEGNLVASVAISLLLVSIFALALSTMSSAFSASLCAIRYDILPAFWPQLRPGSAQPAPQAIAVRRAIMAAGALYLLIIIACLLAAGDHQPGFSSSTFLALLFALYCAQLSFVPLILGPVIGRASGGVGSVGAGWAIVILGFSSAVGLGTVIVYMVTADETWLWAAVPACLGSGLLLFTIARLVSGTRRTAA
jgi:hypothetical protein